MGLLTMFQRLRVAEAVAPKDLQVLKVRRVSKDQLVHKVLQALMARTALMGHKAHKVPKVLQVPMARTGHLALQVLTEPMERMENAGQQVLKVRRETKESKVQSDHKVPLAVAQVGALPPFGGYDLPLQETPMT